MKFRRFHFRRHFEKPDSEKRNSGFAEMSEFRLFHREKKPALQKRTLDPFITKDKRRETIVIRQSMRGLTNRETSKNFISGFVTGPGGLLTPAGGPEISTKAVFGLTFEAAPVYFDLVNTRNEWNDGEARDNRPAIRKIHINLPEEAHQKLRVKCAMSFGWKMSLSAPSKNGF